MSTPLLRRLSPTAARELRRRAISSRALAEAASIIEAVETGGEPELRRLAGQLDGLSSEEPLLVTRKQLDTALEGLPEDQRALLERTAHRVRCFARAQRETISELTTSVSGGMAGQLVSPVRTAGCYAPGGRYPLPSSVLMTAITAREAGVDRVWVASPRPTPVTLAAAALSRADGLLQIGGAHAIAALAFGTCGTPPCDVVVGPGNSWVTAAKKLLLGRIGIDMLAGPSELVILADSSADPTLVAADLLAQAEHDPEALPILVTDDPELTTRVESRLRAQLEDLPTREIAQAALRGGFVVNADSLGEAIAVCNRLAPEHLQVMTRNARALADRLDHYGALFIGSFSAEVLGDYGAGPNHTLPTGGCARFCGGLSVLDFLRVRTWLHLDRSRDYAQLVNDAAALARLEGLEAHARAAELRLAQP